MHMDVNTAFLEAKLQEEIWISLPAGLKIRDKKIEININARSGDTICLNRNLYSGFKLV